MLSAYVFGFPSRVESIFGEQNRRFGLPVPGRSAQTKGKKIYSRRRLFEKIK
jgi:hypothetical protein